MRNIEKQLINSSKSLPKMEKEILIPEYKVNFKLSYKKISVLASILLLFICFGTSLIVSAQIRDAVFGFIKSGIEEIIPSYSQKHNDTGMPILVESKEIEDIADIYYYDLSSFILITDKNYSYKDLLSISSHFSFGVMLYHILLFFFHNTYICCIHLI